MWLFASATRPHRWWFLWRGARRLGARGSESRFLACCLTGWDAADCFSELFGGSLCRLPHRRLSFENENGLWCIQEVLGGERWVRRRPSAHTKGVKTRSLWTKQVSGAHGRRQDEAIVNENGPQRTREVVDGGCCVRRRPSAHTVAREVVELWITFVIFVSYNISYGV